MEGGQHHSRMAVTNQGWPSPVEGGHHPQSPPGTGLVTPMPTHSHPSLGAASQPNPLWIPPVLTGGLGGFEGHTGLGERGKSRSSVSVTREDTKIRRLQLI